MLQNKHSSTRGSRSSASTARGPGRSWRIHDRSAAPDAGVPSPPTLERRLVRSTPRPSSSPTSSAAGFSSRHPRLLRSSPARRFFSPRGLPAARSRLRARWRTQSLRRCDRVRAVSTSTSAKRLARLPRFSRDGRRSSPVSLGPSRPAPRCWCSTLDGLRRRVWTSRRGGVCRSVPRVVALTFSPQTITALRSSPPWRGCSAGVGPGASWKLLAGLKVLSSSPSSRSAFHLNRLGCSLAESAPFAPAGWLLALIPVMFNYSGWNAATYVAEEVRDPVA